MAEGWIRHLFGDRFQAFSAGVSPHGIDPCAVAVMQEAGVDISEHTSKHVDTLADIHFDWVVTVCDEAAGACPTQPEAVKHIHHRFDDPPALARAVDDEEQALIFYRRVRDEIRGFVDTFALA